LLFPPGNVDRLTHCLERLRRDRAYCQQLAAAGRREIRARGMTWTCTACEYAEFYRDILVRRHQRKPSCAA
jgi:hypothetical protein